MKRLLVWLVVFSGLFLMAKGTFIPAKAAAAQWLLQRAWDRSQEEGGVQRPWPWADTYPVARLGAPAHGVDLIALAGASGSSLAFGPGHVSHSGVPGSNDTVIIGGHRDTHFAFLRDVEIGDTLTLTGTSGATHTYVVESTEIADARHTNLRIEEGSGMLALVTCYPFDALRAGGPLRYVVGARSTSVDL